MGRVKFYSIYDMNISENLSNIKKIVENFNNEKTEYNINDIIEFYNITKYIDTKCYKNCLLDWTERDILKIEKTVKKYKSIISCYLKSISNETIIVIYKEIDYCYKEDFFKLLEKYKIYEKISEQAFDILLHTKSVFLEYILYNKKMTYYYGNIIRQRFFEDIESAEIILDYYEAKSINNEKTIYFPKVLTSQDKEEIIKKYVNSENPNLNYLILINNIRNREELSISDKTRLESIRKTKIENNKLFDKNNGFEYGVEVRFSNKQHDIIEFSEKKHILKYSYDIKWIHENKDYNTILNNFIYLFEYVDNQARVTLVSKKSELGFSEKFFGIKSRNEYETGITFNVKYMLSTMQIIGYYRQLNKLNIRLEDIIEWFFKVYILEEFNIENYNVTMPSKGSTYFEKCKSILPEIDYILKQYNLLAEDGNINQELLEISSTPVLFEKSNSLINGKYIYANYKSNEFNNLCYYFFSDQCVLRYTPKIKSKYKNFYKLLINENVTINDYPMPCQMILNNIINQGYIFIDSNGYIKIKDKKLLVIVKDLNDNEVICYWKYPLEYRNKIDELVKRNMLKKESCLFSKPEQDYFNYYLNQRSFSNSLDLRNKYLHGNKLKYNDEDTHYKNYMVFVKIIILIIIKINDELCMQEELKNNKENENKTNCI